MLFLLEKMEERNQGIKEKGSVKEIFATRLSRDWKRLGANFGEPYLEKSDL